MANPTPYSRAYGFANYQAMHPSDPLPGNEVDAELDSVAAAIASADSAIQSVRRSDGALANAIVTPDSLAATTLALISALGINPRGGWLTGTVYASRDIVTQSSTVYICVTAHTSGVFATDLAAIKWMVLSNPVANQALNTSSSPTFNALIADNNVQAGSLSVTGASTLLGDMAVAHVLANGAGGGTFTASGFGFNGVYGTQGLTTTDGNGIKMICVSAGVILSNAAAAWSAISDERLKTPLLPFADALTKVSQLAAGTGRYLDDEVVLSRSFLTAQSVQAVLPEAVEVYQAQDENDPKNGMLILRYTDVIPLLVAAIQELKARVEALEAK